MSALIVLRDVRTVQLNKGFNALVDEADWPLVSRHSWSLHVVKRPGDTGSVLHYASANESRGSGSPLRLHRFLVDPAEGLWVDHRNGDGLDCRRANLRTCTPAQNSQNKRQAWGKSKYKGVFWESRKNRWAARIKAPNLRKRLGYFCSEQDAARAYDAAARELFGEFACTNAEMYCDLD